MRFGILTAPQTGTAVIAPPVGILPFVVQGVRGRGPLHDAMIGSAPFVVALLVMIALWLPALAR